jgi:hypothetical protein
MIKGKYVERLNLDPVLTKNFVNLSSKNSTTKQARGAHRLNKTQKN